MKTAGNPAAAGEGLPLTTSGWVNFWHAQ